MSLLNGFQGQSGGRPAARPGPQAGTQEHAQQQHAQQQAAWPAQPAHGQQGHAQQPAGAPPHWTQQAQAAAAAYGQPAPAYGQPQDYRAQQQPQAQSYGQAYGGYPAQNNDPYAPQFEPYSAAPVAPQQAQPSYQPQAAQQQYAPAQPRQAAPQWSPQQADPRGFDAGSYMSHAQAAAAQASASYRTAEREPHGVEPSLSDWGHAGADQNGYAHQQQGGADLGFAQASGGELEQGYTDEENHDYEEEEELPRRGRRPLMIAAALAGAILIGGGMAYSYKNLVGGSSSGEPPVIKSANEPSKTKPADAGGKQFAHTDSKIMGRLGDGASATAGSASAAAAGELDANGTRKVSTLVVGRDGSIQAPAAAPAAPVEVAAVAPAAASAAPSAASVSVPGMTVVDAFGGQKAQTAAAAVVATGTAASDAAVQATTKAAQKLVVAPPAAPQKPVTIDKAAVAEAQTQAQARAVPDVTGSVDPAAAAVAAPAKKPVAKKVAAAVPAAAAASAPVAGSNSVATTGSGANGFVAVLASVPRSTSSRLDALKRFADMQQKYGSVLGGKTPDVAEADLGAKGAYHRLVVGPPGSRDQASSLCSQLKTQGYGDCWVTSY